LITDFLCPAVVRCASENMLQICTRSAELGVSSGITTFEEEKRDAVDERDFRVAADDLRDTAAVDTREVVDSRIVVRDEVLPGIFEVTSMT
jgi:hypothetical protein